MDTSAIEAHETPPGYGAVIGTVTAQEYVFSQLRRWILDGTLSGGTRLKQPELARRLGVSVTPLREALRQLASDGLVDLDPNKGASVHAVSLEEVHEIYTIRMRLEPFAMKLAASVIEPAQIAEARRFLTQMSNTDDDATWVTLNRDFHAYLVDIVRMPHLSTIVRSLSSLASLYVARRIGHSTTQRDGADRDHVNLIEALEQGDGARAEAVLYDHLEATRASYNASRS